MAKTKNEALAAMDPESRQRFCRQVMEGLSDLVEGEAPEDFCRQVDEVLGDCEPYVALRNTLEATIELTRGLGEDDALPEILDDDAFARCVERVRSGLKK